MRRIWCRIFGHKWDPDAAEFYRVYWCERCGTEEYEHSTGEMISWRIRMWVRDTWWSWRKWWRCRDCGRHCGRHTKECEDVPF